LPLCAYLWYVLNELFNTAREKAAKPVQDISAWVVTSVIRQLGQSHSMYARGVRNLHQRYNAVLTKLLLRD